MPQDCVVQLLWNLRNTFLINSVRDSAKNKICEIIRSLDVILDVGGELKYRRANGDEERFASVERSFRECTYNLYENELLDRASTLETLFNKLKNVGNYNSLLSILFGLQNSGRISPLEQQKYESIAQPKFLLFNKITPNVRVVSTDNILNKLHTESINVSILQSMEFPTEEDIKIQFKMFDDVPGVKEDFFNHSSGQLLDQISTKKTSLFGALINSTVGENLDVIMSLPELPDISEDQLSNSDIGLMLPIVNYSDTTDQLKNTTITVKQDRHSNNIKNIEERDLNLPVIDWSTLDYKIVENNDDDITWDSLITCQHPVSDDNTYISINDGDILESIFSLLIGMPSRHFYINSDERIFHTNSKSGPLQALLVDYCELGSLVYRMQSFIEYYTTTVTNGGGLLIQSFARSVSTFLDIHISGILHLQSGSIKLSLLEVYQILNVSLVKKLKFVAKLCYCSLEYKFDEGSIGYFDIPKGPQLLSHLYDVIINTHESECKTIAINLFQNTIPPYLNSLTSWVYQGVLIPDEFQEFAIDAVRAPTKDEQYWKNTFIIREPIMKTAPKFLLHLMEHILCIGKSINLLKLTNNYSVIQPPYPFDVAISSNYAALQQFIQSSLVMYDNLFQNINSNITSFRNEDTSSLTNSVSTFAHSLSRSESLRIEKLKEREKKKAFFESLNQQVVEKELRKTIEKEKDRENEEKASKIQENNKIIVEEEKAKLLSEHSHKIALLDKKIARTRWLTQRLKLSPLRLKLWDNEKMVENNSTIGEMPDIVENSDQLALFPTDNEEINVLCAQQEEDVEEEGSKESIKPLLFITESEEGFSDSVKDDLKFEDISTQDTKEEEEEESYTTKSLFNESVDDSVNKDFLVELPFSTVVELSVGQPLLLHYKYINKMLLSCLFKEFNIYKHFSMLREYLLMHNGVFVDSLTSLLFTKPFTTLNNWTIPQLNSMLDASIKLSNISSHIPKLAFKVDTSISHDIEESIILHYNVEWPLNIIINEDSLKNYNKLFRLLLKLKRVGFALQSVWSALKLTNFKKEHRNVCVKLQMFRHEMQHLLDILQMYITQQLNELSWKEFTLQLEKVTTMDNLINVHESYLTKCLTRCLLTDKNSGQFHIINNILEIILKYSYFTIQIPLDDSIDKWLSQILIIKQTFSKYTGFLHMALKGLATSSTQFHIQDLFNTWNFNQFYSVKHK